MSKSFPHIKQPDSIDCGATCLAMIAKHYGKTKAEGRKQKGERHMKHGTRNTEKGEKKLLRSYTSYALTV